MMLAKIIFFTAVSAATVSVILLALFSPSAHRKNQSRPWFALSLYVQHSHIPNPPHKQPHLHGSSAFIFHHKLTEGPKNTSRIMGKVQGFVIPIEQSYSLMTAFNIIYLTFDAPEYSGSLGVEAVSRHGTGHELMVVGGTGFFAFARGVAVFAQRGRQQPNADAMYQIKLWLRLPAGPSTSNKGFNQLRSK